MKQIGEFLQMYLCRIRFRETISKISRFKVLQTNILLTLGLLETPCLEFSSLNSSTIGVRLSKTLVMTIFYYLKV